MPNSIVSFMKRFPDSEACLKHLFDVRFGQDYDCPKCEKSTSWHRIKAERAYSCQRCGHHLHPTVGTLFEKSRTDLHLWFFALHLFTITRNGVSAKELQRSLGVTYKCAHRMGHKIREHMAAVDGDDQLGGEGKIVEVDEVYLGGKAPMHRKKENKITVQGMVERDGDVTTEVVTKLEPLPNRKLASNVSDNVKKGTEVHTDEYNAYKRLGKVGYEHKTVHHGSKEYARDEKCSETGKVKGDGIHLTVFDLTAPDQGQ